MIFLISYLEIRGGLITPPAPLMNNIRNKKHKCKINEFNALPIEKLVRYKGEYWLFYGVFDNDSERLHLVNLKDQSKGVRADKLFCRLVVGIEYYNQMQAIEYFRSIGVC